MLSQKFVLLRSKYFTTSAAIRITPAVPFDPDRCTIQARVLLDAVSEPAVQLEGYVLWIIRTDLENQQEEDPTVDPLLFHALSYRQ